ncbi:hypothetical protein Y032_0519g2833 [Ancylostoma ceylanicum]|uniref:Uncharacterized protein n=1 Tax=Ancylostoma ceylanicum TaxID=53326 RepID=A0A016WSF6_9BILA|nr:hypothetical protein Y032_0519g2833 [Ancylostoma ceylanicum]
MLERGSTQDSRGIPNILTKLRNAEYCYNSFLSIFCFFRILCFKHSCLYGMNCIASWAENAEILARNNASSLKGEAHYATRDTSNKPLLTAENFQSQPLTRTCLENSEVLIPLLLHSQRSIQKEGFAQAYVCRAAIYMRCRWHWPFSGLEKHSARPLRSRWNRRRSDESGFSGKILARAARSRRVLVEAAKRPPPSTLTVCPDPSGSRYGGKWMSIRVPHFSQPPSQSFKELKCLGPLG